MPPKSQTPPTPQEIGDRILHNLIRVQGYLDVLQSEIDDPQKIGISVDRAQLSRVTQDLKSHLIQLEDVLS